MSLPAELVKRDKELLKWLEIHSRLVLVFWTNIPNNPVPIGILKLHIHMNINRLAKKIMISTKPHVTLDPQHRPPILILRIQVLEALAQKEEPNL
jgi:hypothetical protein